MQNQFYVYILKCKNDQYYIGHTDNIEQRLSEHHLGSISNCYTKGRRPLELMFVQTFATRDEAFRAERQIKGWSRAKKKALIEDNWEEIKKLNDIQKKFRSARGYPSTSSGRAQESHGLVFTAEPVEASGRAQESHGLVFTAEPPVEASGRAQESHGLVFTAEPVEASGRAQQTLRCSQIISTQEYIIEQNEQQSYTFVFDKNANVPKDIVLRFYVEAHATLTLQLLIINTNLHIKIECILRGQGAYAHVYGAYMISQEHSVTIDTLQHHQAMHTSSSLIIKGALRDKACARYNGTIRIEKQAQGSCASQENKNIVISNEARVISVPNLEVLANDVKCFHGSAIGRFDSEQLFYAASRGIDEKAAEHMLLNAFFADVLDDGLRKNVSLWL